MKTFFGMMAIIVAGSLYGCLNSIVKLAYNGGFSFAQVTYSQYIFGGMGLAILVLLSKSYRKMQWKAVIRLGLIGFIGLGGTSLFLYASLDRLSAPMAIVLLFQFTWISLVVERLFLKKSIIKQQVISVIVILIGTFCCLEITQAIKSHISVLGVLFGLSAAICYSIFLIGSATLPSDVPPFLQSFVMVFVNVFLLFLLFAPFQPSVNALNPFSSIWRWGIILGILGQFLPPLLFTFGAPIVGGTMTSILGSVELPVGVLFSSIVLHEPIHVIQWLGILLILVGIVFSQIRLGKERLKEL